MSKRGAISVTAFKEMVHHIWHVGRMRFVSHEANLGFGGGHLVYQILMFLLPSSARSPAMTDILFTGILNLHLINQSK